MERYNWNPWHGCHKKSPGCLHCFVFSQDAFYQKKSGPYEAGTLKLKKDFIDFTGFDNIRDLFTPEVRIDQLQGKQ